MAERNNEPFKFKEKPVELKDCAIVFNKESFLLAFNFNKDNVPENAFVLPAEQMTSFIVFLFDAGKRFEEINHVDIGFGADGDDANE